MVRLRILWAGLLLSALSLPTSTSRAETGPRSEVMSMATKVIAAFNAGDTKAVAGMVADNDPVIIDNFPPFVWKGADSLSRWLEDYGRDAEANGITDTNSRLGATKHVKIEGDRAYAAVADTYTYKRKGKPVREDLVWTFAARKVGAEWKLMGWSLSGGAKP